MKPVKIVAFLQILIVTAYAQQQQIHKLKKTLNCPVSLVKTSDSTVKIDGDIILNNKNLPLFIEDLKRPSISVYYKFGKVPSFIKSFLIQLPHDRFSIADPGKDWNCCCEKDDHLPDRQMICGGMDKNLFFISYLTGGIGEMEHLILIRYKNNVITDFWTGKLSGHLNNKKVILQYLIENEHSSLALHGEGDI